MRRLLKWLVILGVLGGTAAAAGYPALAWWQKRFAPKYLTATVSRGRVETVVNSTGTVKPVRTVSVGAFTSGPLAEVNVDYNSKVYQDRFFFPGTLLAVIDDRLQKAAVDRDTAALRAAEADRDRIQALLDQAKNNENRAVRLHKINKDYISETDMDQFRYAREALEAQVKLAEATIKQATATLKNSVDQLGYTRIVSPADGIVIERKVDPGQTVAASFQTPELFTIGLEMDKKMHVYASVDEADIGQIRAAHERERHAPGTRGLAKFTIDAYPGELFEGRIDQIRMNATTTQNVVTYPVIIEAPNPDLKLMPNMTANISFQIEAKDDVLRLPAAALRFVPATAQVRPEDRHYLDALPASPNEGAPKRSAGEKAEQARNRSRRVVWVQDGLLLRAVPVTLGLIENQYAELLAGDLAEEQAVVTGTESPLAAR